jgi:hypothetical protein
MLEEPQYSKECLVCKFFKDEDLVEVTLWSSVNLSTSITGKAVVWVKSDTPGATAYRLHCSLNKPPSSTLKYLNGNWYYLYWRDSWYYTKPRSWILTPISLRLGTHLIPVMETPSLWTGHKNTTDESERTQTKSGSKELAPILV